MYTIIKYIAAIILFTSCSQDEKVLTDDEIDIAFAKVNNQALWDEIRARYKSSNSHREDLYQLDGSLPNHQQQRDSTWKVINAVDDDNARWLIDFTKKYGMPTIDRTCQEKGGAWMLFHHSNSKYWDEILPLVEREWKARRINRPTYIALRWHLNGRVGTPDDMEIEIIKKERNLNF